MQTDTRLISLTQGKSATVNAIDYDALSQWKWHATKTRTSTGYVRYAARWQAGKRVFMHQEIPKLAGWPTDTKYDHKDHDGLNNTRSNLRPCTNSQNHMNTRKAAGKSSQYKGVCWDKSSGKWIAHIHPGGTQMHLGRFESERDAANAYALAARQLFGEFACLK